MNRRATSSTIQFTNNTVTAAAALAFVSRAGVNVRATATAAAAGPFPARGQRKASDYWPLAITLVVGRGGGTGSAAVVSRTVVGPAGSRGCRADVAPRWAFGVQYTGTVRRARAARRGVTNCPA